MSVTFKFSEEEENLNFNTMNLLKKSMKDAKELIIRGRTLTKELVIELNTYMDIPEEIAFRSKLNVGSINKGNTVKITTKYDYNGRLHGNTIIYEDDDDFSIMILHFNRGQLLLIVETMYFSEYKDYANTISMIREIKDKKLNGYTYNSEFLLMWMPIGKLSYSDNISCATDFDTKTVLKKYKGILEILELVDCDIK